MKKSCPKCHTIVEINENEYNLGSEVRRQCPLCGETVLFVIPKITSTIESALDKMNGTIIALQQQLNEIRSSFESERVALSTALKAAEERASRFEALAAAKEAQASNQTPDNKNFILQNLTFTVKDVSFTMVYVEGGSFMMGMQHKSSRSINYDRNANDDEVPLHEVSLKDFYMGETEVTQALWRAVMESEPTYDDGWTLEFGRDDNMPAYRVSYNDVLLFVSKLSQLTGRRFRMPTEAEWEYAARGGVKRKGYRYAGSNTLDAVAWYYDNSGGIVRSVKTKKPNELGLYDMSGNVWEWCSDRYGTYDSGSQVDPKGPAGGSCRVYRGGCFLNDEGACRVSYRGYDYPSQCSNIIGFRLVLQ